MPATFLMIKIKHSFQKFEISPKNMIVSWHMQLHNKKIVASIFVLQSLLSCMQFFSILRIVC